jgi:polysaccharide biosynthesis protein PslJ
VTTGESVFEYRPRKWSIAALLSQGVILALVGALAVAAGLTSSPLMGLAALCLAFVYASVYLLSSWNALVGVLFLTIWFIPIKRYHFPVNLPFDLEPYRVLVAVLLLIWLVALLIHPGVRLRRSGLELPLLSFFLVILISISVNFRRIESIGVTVDVLKTLSFFASFVLTYLLVLSVTRTRQALDLFVRILVAGGAVVAFFGAIEYRTGYNIFNHLAQYVPILRYQGDLTDITRSDRLRVYASAQHPIALAAVLVMMIPLGIYLAQSTKKLRWWVATCLLAIGAIATLSRTGIVMLLVSALVFSLLRPLEARRLAPLALPAVMAVFLVLPQALGTLQSAFFPKGGLVADQATVGYLGDGHRSGRIVTLGPSFREWEKRPIFGEGFGSRIFDPTNSALTNANILDDQWLDQLLETGAFGIAAFIWIFARTARRLKRIARGPDSRDGLLAGALATSILAFAAGALTFDAFSFIQVTFIFFIMLALAASLLVLRNDAALAEASATGS